MMRFISTCFVGFLLSILTLGYLGAQIINENTQSLDTIPLPTLVEGDDRNIRFYKQYTHHNVIEAHLVLNSSPNNDGNNWYTAYAEGKLVWEGDLQLSGELDVLYHSNTKVVGSIISELVQNQRKKAKIHIDASSALVTVNLDDNYVYSTNIANHTIYGFNNSNHAIILTLENPN